jgi:hypothetical protein
LLYYTHGLDVTRRLTLGKRKRQLGRESGTPDAMRDAGNLKIKEKKYEKTLGSRIGSGFISDSISGSGG